MGKTINTDRPIIEDVSGNADIPLDTGETIELFVRGALAFKVKVGDDRVIVVIYRDLYESVPESEVESLVLDRALEMVRAGEHAAWL